MDEEKRLEIFKWTLERLTESLKRCDVANKEKMSRIVQLIKTATKSFTSLLPQAFATPILAVVEYLA